MARASHEYTGDKSAEQWVTVHTQPWAAGREASGELWNAFKKMAPEAAQRTSRTSFGKAVAEKYGKAKVTKVGKKTTRWFYGIRLLPQPRLNQKSEGYKFLFSWRERSWSGQAQLCTQKRRKTQEASIRK